MNEVSAGWKRQRIGSLCKLINGCAFKPSDWTDTGFPIVRIQNLNNSAAKFNRFNGQVRPRFLIDSGALLFAWSGTPGTSFGAHIWNGGPAVLNQHIFNVLFDESKLDKRFFQFAINQKLDELIDKAHGGVGLRHVTKGKFEETEIDVPPLDKQRRIVDALDKLLARSEATRAELDGIPQLIERMKLATIARFLPSGDEPSVKRITLAELCVPDRIITYGVIKLGEEVLDGSPCLRTSNVRWLRIETEEMKRIARELSLEYSRTILEGAEVLVNVRGTLGGVAVASSEMKGWNVSREVAVVPVDTSRFDSDYVAYWIGSGESQSWLRGVEKGVAYIGINLGDLRKLPILCPPINEQRRIVKLIRAGHQRADLIALEVSRATTLNERLQKAALEKAFRGELLLEEKPINAVAAL